MEFLNITRAYLGIIRPKNLIITGLTQLTIYQCLIGAISEENVLSGTLLWLFILTTVLIAAGGFIINDIVDVEKDKINKPQKTYIPIPISIEAATYYYYVILGIGMILTIYLGIVTDNMPLITLYPLACLGLYLYSTKYKGTVLIGNIIVSLFVAFVTGIVVIAERKLLFGSLQSLQIVYVKELLLFFMTFSFLVNLLREIIKDIEDIKGDSQHGAVTLPIKFGIPRTIKYCIALAGATVLLLIIWLASVSIPLEMRIWAYILLFVACPLLLVIQILAKTNQKRDFSNISSILKWTMIAGLGACILVSKNISNV